ncbi:hypothetical protein BT93_J0041 [Corymbia citriodora subsp. variegata]|nr:hypothetical protein BT93_J0041 [Corymbia citriodora subsp. variegata]KAF8008924.1 hypothetical protein BT93_J0041 [Corymbia citriodora subsp. variegata]
MDVKLSIGEEDDGMSYPIKEEVKKDEMDSLEEEDIWRSQRERMNNALAAARTAARQEPEDMYAAASRLVEVTKSGDLEGFISVIERLADQTNPSATLNFQGLLNGSLLHVAAETGKDDILRLLLDFVSGHLIAAQNECGNTPLHTAAKAGGSTAAAMLICRARDLPNMEDNNQILRMKNKHGNTALHEAVLNRHVNVVRLLLSKDPELVYLKNVEKKSPLYLALDTHNNDIHEALFTLQLEPSRIGMPPVHGAVVRDDYDLAAKILKKNIKLFTMLDSGGGNVFHLAAHMNQTVVFELLRPETEHLARQQDMKGDLPIHIASKMGYVELIKKLHLVSHFPNGRGQTILHVAAKYGQASVVKYILKHPELRGLINDRDHDGNTALHLGAMHSQPAALIPLVLDKSIDIFIHNHKCLTAPDIAQQHSRRWQMLPEMLSAIVLRSTSAKSTDLLVFRPEDRHEVLSIAMWRVYRPIMDVLKWKDVINARLVVATLVTTVTFTAGFTVPGGLDDLEIASKDERGMAVMLDNRMFQVFTICNTIAMFCSMIAVIALMYAQHHETHIAKAGVIYAAVLLTIALPAMSAAFLAGVTLTVAKLPWLANTIFYFGLLFLLIISAAAMLQLPPLFRSPCRPLLHLKCWLVLGYIYLCGGKMYPAHQPKEDGTTSNTSTSRPLDGAGESRADDSATAKSGDSPQPPNHKL